MSGNPPLCDQDALGDEDAVAQTAFSTPKENTTLSKEDELRDDQLVLHFVEPSCFTKKCLAYPMCQPLRETSTRQCKVAAYPRGTTPVCKELSVIIELRWKVPDPSVNSRFVKWHFARLRKILATHHVSGKLCGHWDVVLVHFHFVMQFLYVNICQLAAGECDP